jgi:hypothetical protein
VTLETGAILDVALGFLEYLSSRMNQAPNFVISTGAVLCALSFTAGTILLQKLPVVPKKSQGEKWLEDFLARLYSMAIDTGYHQTGTIVKQYFDEFIFHEFPNFGVDRSSYRIARTRPNFELGRFLSEELGSNAYVSGPSKAMSPEPIETSRMVRYSSPLGILWWKIPGQLRALLGRVTPLKRPILELAHERWGLAQYTTASYRLFPVEQGTRSGPKTKFIFGTPTQLSFDEIKRFEGKTGRAAHLALDIRFLLEWYSLVFRRLPSRLRHPHDGFYRLGLLSAKQIRREDTQLLHTVLEMRNLHLRILYSRPTGKRIWPSLATVTFVFDRKHGNHAKIFMYTTELEYSAQARQFADSMLGGARGFGLATVLGILSLFLPTSMVGLVSLVPYSWAWYVLFHGLWKFGKYFVVSKEQENVGFVQPLRCPSCKREIDRDTLVCPHCKSTVSTKLPPKPPTVFVVSEKEPISVERWNRLVTSARREHAGTSRKTMAVPHRPAQHSDILKFKEFRQRLLVGPEILIDAYSAGGTYTPPEIIGIGRNIAIQEEGYLVRKLADAIANKTRISRLSGREMEDAILHCRINPNIVFAPIEYYTPLHIDPHLGMQIRYDRGRERLAIGKMTMPIFWSNTYVPFNEFMFMESGLGVWVFKPDNESNWLWMEVSPERKNGKFEVTASTLADFVVNDKNKGLIVAVETRHNNENPTGNRAKILTF